METKTIMKYNREKACWLCPDCDVENEMSLYQCRVCGFVKSNKVLTLNPGEAGINDESIESVIDEFDRMADTTGLKASGSKTTLESEYTDWEYGEKENSDEGKKIVWVAIVLILLVLIVAIVAGFYYAW